MAFGAELTTGGEGVFLRIAGKSRSWDARTGLRPAADSSTLWSQGKLSVIVRTGTVIPGIGTIDNLAPPQLVIPPHRSTRQLPARSTTRPAK